MATGGHRWVALLGTGRWNFWAQEGALLGTGGRNWWVALLGTDHQGDCRVRAPWGAQESAFWEDVI
ncbi:unnamed protein product [Staurois parvus]|uniref:Uncharacterized protein n=1 Tax=Staurois parvus TaxID=386267 RepID=A0ABN9E731_9NEOB|nr:unnamed protein product [Staurois parvus]